MKIFRKNTLYVQKKDLLYLLTFNIDMPKTLKENLERIDINETNQHEFIRFTKKDEINYYNNLKWIIDYDEYINLTEEEILTQGNIINTKINRLLNNKTDKESLKEYKESLLRLQSLREAFWLKRGHTIIKIPIEGLIIRK